MPSFGLTLLSALCLAFVAEGLLYALFPDSMKRLMAIALAAPARTLRLTGLAAAGLGVAMLYFLKALSGS